MMRIFLRVVVGNLSFIHRTVISEDKLPTLLLKIDNHYHMILVIIII